MSPELKAKWIQSIKELPLHRTGGYFEIGSLFEDYDRNPSCAACAIGKLYQVIRRDYPSLTQQYIASVDNRLLSVFDFLFSLDFKHELRNNFSALVKTNDMHESDDNISDEEVKSRLVAIIEANF